MLARAGKDEGYEDIKVHERWLVFENFLSDVGRRPTPEHTIERLDTFGDYEPSNVVWALRDAQQSNQRDTFMYEMDNIVDTLTGWSKRLGVSKQLLKWRFESWGSFEKNKRTIQKRLYEKSIKDQVKKLLREFGAYWYMPVPNGFGAPSLDFLGSYKGMFFAVETKVPGKRPTPRQNRTMEDIKASGAAVFLIDGDTTQLREWLEKVK